MHFNNFHSFIDSFALISLPSATTMPEIFSIAFQQQIWTDPCDWHNHTPADLREHILERIISKLLRNIAVYTDDENLSTERFSEVIELAKLIENQSFNAGSSRGDYYRLLDINMNKSESELREDLRQYKEECRRNLYLVERPATKTWHVTFASNLRRVVISTFVDEILPSNEQSLLSTQSKERLLQLAARSEVMAYDAAGSRAQYYKVLGEAISEIKYRIEDLRQQVRGTIGSSITSSAIDMITQPNNINEQSLF